MFLGFEARGSRSAGADIKRLTITSPRPEGRP
jgi:hypothetical protein